MNYPFFFFIFTLVAKGILGIFIPLFSDEAYYWVWSHHTQMSFFDHPPMVSWLFFLGIPFENFFSAPRIPGIILGHCTLFIWYHIISPYLEKERQKWLLWALLLTPLTGLGSLVITPDLPLLFFWSAALYFLLRLAESKKSVPAFFLGAAIGLGFCSKYHMVLFPMIALLWLFTQRKNLSLPFRAYTITILAAIMFSLPVLLWNYNNDFVSFKFQLNHGLGEARFNPRWSLKYLFDQFFLILPPILFLALRRIKSNIQDWRLNWLYYFGWGPILFFLFTSLKGRVEANWPLVGLPALISLALINAAPRLTWIKVSVATWVAVLGVVLAIIFLPIDKYKYANSKIREINEATMLLPFVNEFQPFYVSTYQLASLLSYYTKTPVYKLNGVGRTDFYDFIESSKPKAKKFYWVAPSASYLPKWAQGYSVKLVAPQSIISDNFLFEVISP